uniref:(northern house mosquito) hypothetical protein n=1 Tax=Culex pipiens TaxID=7175 RepID=A0A8D8A0T1_CULPI
MRRVAPVKLTAVTIHAKLSARGSAKLMQSFTLRLVVRGFLLFKLAQEKDQVPPHKANKTKQPAGDYRFNIFVSEPTTGKRIKMAPSRKVGCGRVGLKDITIDSKRLDK